METIVIIFVLIIIGYSVGSHREKKHYLSIVDRENKLSEINISTAKTCNDVDKTVMEVKLVFGAVVIGQDYFKRVAASFKNLFGGRLKSYESLLDRGRREAILRLKEQSIDFDEILNLRIETSMIGVSRDNKSSGCIEVIAYGTAMKFA